MKIQLTKTETTEVEVIFPTYVSQFNGRVMYAILSDNKCIGVHKWNSTPNDCLVNTQAPATSAFNCAHKIITEKEFADFYKSVVDIIYNECEAFLDNIEEKRNDAQVCVPNTDIEYGEAQMEEFDRFMDKSNDHHERQMEQHFDSEAGQAF